MRIGLDFMELQSIKLIFQKLFKPLNFKIEIFKNIEITFFHSLLNNFYILVRMRQIKKNRKKWSFTLNIVFFFYLNRAFENLVAFKKG